MSIKSTLHEIGAISASVERPVLTSFAGEITWRAEDGTLVEKWQNLNYEKNITKPVYKLATKIDQLLANSSLK